VRSGSETMQKRAILIQLNIGDSAMQHKRHLERSVRYLNVFENSVFRLTI